LGLGALLMAAPMLTLAVKLVGVAYLLWMAFKLSQSRQMGEADAAKLQVGFWQGVALQFVNIKAWMLALAIVSGWIAGRGDTAQRLAVVIPVMLVFAFSSNMLYATLGSLLRDWLRGPLGTGRRLLAFNRVMALILLVTALWMLTV
jgi:threonine/homoserine/homoserine lactone efflux protein